MQTHRHVERAPRIKRSRRDRFDSGAQPQLGFIFTSLPLRERLRSPPRSAWRKRLSVGRFYYGMTHKTW